MQIVISQASKTDAHNIDDSKRQFVNNQVHPAYSSSAERRKANSKAREQMDRFKGR